MWVVLSVLLAVQLKSNCPCAVISAYSRYFTVCRTNQCAFFPCMHYNKCFLPFVTRMACQLDRILAGALPQLRHRKYAGNSCDRWVRLGV